MCFSIVDDFIAEHSGHGVVPNVPTDPDATEKYFHCPMFLPALVQEHALLSGRREDQSDVGLVDVLQRLQAHVGIHVEETDAAQLFALLSFESF